MANPSLTLDELRSIGLFGAIGDDVLNFLTSRLDVLDLAAGDTVFQEGDEARDMFVVVSGEMEVLKRSNGGVDARVAMLGPGDWFGEMSLLDVQPRSATVRALAHGRLLKIGSRDLDALYRHDLKAYSIVILNIARELSRRLRVADGLLADFVADVMGRFIDRPRPSAS